jgi:hypothetical protein
MLTPLQQTPIPLDPVRQQITPTPPLEPPAPQRLADVPIQAADRPQDKFNPKNDKRGGRRDQAQEDRQRAETANKLRSAYLRLNELQQQAGAAFAAGDAMRAKELAAEAAQVAQTIPSNVGIIELQAQENSIGNAANAAGEDELPALDMPAALDLARAGLGAAKTVVDSAADIPHHPVEDRIAIGGMKHQVLTAMADVETIAARVSDAQPPVVTFSRTGHIDVRA